MIKSLEQYFIQFGHLELPKIGSLKWLKKEAEWQNGKLIAPSESIILDCIDTKPTKAFYNFLGDALNISTEQAIIQYDQLLDNAIENNEPITIGNLGTIKKVDNAYIWLSNFNSTTYFSDINLGNVSLSDSSINTVHKSNKMNWKIWALLLFAIAAIAILFKQF